MDQYSREIELLAKNKIEDIDQLNNYQQQKQEEPNDLLKQRQGCYYQRQRARTMDKKEEWSARAKLFTPGIKKLRLQIKACENIRNRSFDKEIERIAQKKIKQRYARQEDKCMKKIIKYVEKDGLLYPELKTVYQEKLILSKYG